MRYFSVLLFFIAPVYSIAQDTLKVHFLYGSRPKKEYQYIEHKWFGGIKGGHVGIEGDSDRVINFLPNGGFHAVANPKNRNSTFAVNSVDEFYATFSSPPADMKKAIVYIPITSIQKAKFDSLTAAYMVQTPYDYAFLGMRCAAASHEILGELGIVVSFGDFATTKQVFYPKLLRQKLFRMAKENGWRVEKHAGTTRRKWEND